MTNPDRAQPEPRVRRRTLAPDEHLQIDPAEWRDALVIVAAGAIEVVTRHGARRRFAAGAMLPFVELSIVEVINDDPRQPVTLVALHRPGADSAVSDHT